MPDPHDFSTGVTLETAKLPSLGSTVEFFGHVTLVHGYALTSFMVVMLLWRCAIRQGQQLLC
jgi:hypothetical protein